MYSNKLKIKITKNSFSYTLMCLSLILLVTNFLIYQILKLDDYKMLYRVGALLLATFSAQYSSKVSKRVLLFFIIMVVMIIESKEGIVIAYVFAMTYFMKNRSEKDIIHGCYCAGIFSFFLYILMFIMQKVETTIYTYGGRIRNDLGFLNINTGAAFFLSISLLVILEKKNKSAFLVAIVLEVVIYAITDSRTPMVLFVCFVFLHLLFAYITKKNKGTKVCKYLVFTLIVLTVGIPFVSDYLLIKLPVLNRLFSNRLYLYSLSLAKGTVRSVFLGGREDWLVDNSILCIFFLFGIGVLLFFLFCFVFAIHNMWENQRYDYVAYITSVILGSLMESYLMSPELLFVYLFWFIIFKYSIFYIPPNEKICTQI